MLCHKICKEAGLSDKEGLPALSLLLKIHGDKNSSAHQKCCQYVFVVEGEDQKECNFCWHAGQCCVNGT